MANLPYFSLDAFRKVSWVKAALKKFKRFPKGARDVIEGALTLAAQGEKAEIAKPMKGMGAGVFEIALKYRADAYRTVYAVKIDEKIWVLHAFMKKSKTGRKTPKLDIDLIKGRVKILKEMVK